MKNRIILCIAIGLCVGAAKTVALNQDGPRMQPMPYPHEEEIGIGEYEQGQINGPRICLCPLKKKLVLANIEKSQINKPTILPAPPPNSDLINLSPSNYRKNGALAVTSNEMYQQLFDIALALNKNVTSET